MTYTTGSSLYFSDSLFMHAVAIFGAGERWCTKVKSNYFFLIQMLFKLLGVNGRCFAIQGASMLRRSGL